MLEDDLEGNCPLVRPPIRVRVGLGLGEVALGLGWVGVRGGFGEVGLLPCSRPGLQRCIFLTITSVGINILFIVLIHT